MAKKDTSANVLAMLSVEGDRHAAPPAVAERATKADTSVIELPSSDGPQPAAGPQSRPEAPSAVEAPNGPSSRPARPKAAPVPAQTSPPVSQPEQEQNAPRTTRLDQKTANDLRAGWLDARRRGELTISQQEYAGRIISLGLAAEARQLTGR
jgi:hypothetical protein